MSKGTESSRPLLTKNDSVVIKSDTKEESSNYIIDLDGLINRWVLHIWNSKKKDTCFAGFKTGKKNNLEYEDLNININLNNVKITQESAEFDEEYIDKSTSEQTLFNTSFTNRTEETQETQFKTDRTTRQTTEFSFNNGFKIGTNSSNLLKLVLPRETHEYDGGIKREVFIEYGRNEIVEENINWNCDSSIKVKPKTKISCSLMITEVELERKFSGKSFIEGRVIAILAHDKYGFIKSMSADFFQIVQLAIANNWIPLEPSIFEIKNNKVKTKFDGVCKFRLGYNQKVNLGEASYLDSKDGQQ